MSDLDDFFEDEKVIEILKKINSKTKKYYWNDSIQSQDKNNNINFERRKFSPSIVIKNKRKRIGINKKKARFTSDDVFNEFNN